MSITGFDRPEIRYSRCRFGWPLACLAAACALLSAGVAAWFYAWRRHCITNYHGSWTTQERAALASLDEYLRVKAPRSLMHQAEQAYAAWVGEPPSLREKWGMLREIRDSVRPVHEALLRSAACGQGDIYTSLGDSPARWAVWDCNMEAIKALVRHGCDPNHHYADEGLANKGWWENVVATLIAGSLPGDGKPLEVEERLRMLDWLVDHGARIDAFPPDLLGHYCLVSDLIAEDCGAAFEWCRRHGAQLDPESLDCYSFYMENGVWQT